MRKLFLVAMLVALTSNVAVGDEPGLSIGDALPEMKISHFLQGDEIAALDKNRVYVLEFWATW